ncbi:MAG: long-chain fatty acid--CoA ligase, partial [Steroidobacteraceae bacterium]
MSFAALHAAVTRLATHLVSCGMSQGDRVAIVMRNVPEWPVAFWAVTLAGGIATPLNAWCTGAELAFGLQDSGATIAIVDAERWARLHAHIDACPALQKIYVARGADEIADRRAGRLEAVIGASGDWAELPQAPLPRVALDPDDDVAIFYTSGTTGKPKGAVLTHRNIISGMLNALAAQARAFVRRGQTPPRMDANTPQKATLLSVPFFHVTGCLAVMIPRLMTGAKIVLQRRWDVEAALPLIEKERLTSLGGVPTILWQILDHPRIDEYDLSCVDVISYGGAPAAPELLRRIRERFPRILPIHNWGMTENAAVALTNLAEDYQL